MAIVIVVFVLGALTFLSGYYAKGLDTVYPNVSVGGIDLSRLTLEQARDALISAGYEQRDGGVSVTVSFPDGEALVINSSEAGNLRNASEAAQAAYDFGRNKQFVLNGLAYVKSLFSKTELSNGEAAGLDEAYVRGIVAERVKSFNATRIDESCVIETDRIIIVKGGGSTFADEQEAFDLTMNTLRKAISEGADLTAEYTVLDSVTSDIDLLALYNTVNTEPVSAVYDSETKEISDSVTGVSFDMSAAQTMLDRAAGGEKVVIPLIFTEPEVTRESLEGLLFRDVLSSTKTYIDGTSNRLNNVVVSTAAVNGLILNPGDLFSFNEVVGQRTAARGYKEAGAYVGGRTVQEIGGGICQTSSTIYDAVLYADLEVVSRANHMFTIPYLPLGNDATISWGSIDFKFKNNTDYPIRIDAVTEGRYLTVSLIGTKLNDNYIKIRYEVVKTTGFQVVYEEDESIEPGKTKVDVDGHTGYVVDNYRYLYDKDDTLIEKTFISRSTYRAQNRVILVPVGSLENPDDPTAPPTEPTSGSPSSPSESPTEPSESPTAPSESPSESPSETPPETSAPPSESPSESVPPLMDDSQDTEE